VIPASRRNYKPTGPSGARPLRPPFARVGHARPPDLDKERRDYGGGPTNGHAASLWMQPLGNCAQRLGHGATGHITMAGPWNLCERNSDIDPTARAGDIQRFIAPSSALCPPRDQVLLGEKASGLTTRRYVHGCREPSHRPAQSDRGDRTTTTARQKYLSAFYWPAYTPQARSSCCATKSCEK